MLIIFCLFLIMKNCIDIPVIVQSGKKYKTLNGIVAIKDGLLDRHKNIIHIKKPEWLKVKNNISLFQISVKTSVGRGK